MTRSWSWPTSRNDRCARGGCHAIESRCDAIHMPCDDCVMNSATNHSVGSPSHRRTYVIARHPEPRRRRPGALPIPGRNGPTRQRFFFGWFNLNPRENRRQCNAGTRARVRTLARAPPTLGRDGRARQCIARKVPNPRKRGPTQCCSARTVASQRRSTGFQRSNLCEVGRRSIGWIGAAARAIRESRIDRPAPGRPASRQPGCATGSRRR